MSCDFGPIPMPTSPIQEYFERRLKASRPSSENVTPAIPVSPQSPQVERGIEEQLTRALAKLAKEQVASNEAATRDIDSNDGTPLDSLPPRRGSLAASTGYTASPTLGRLKRRSLVGGTVELQ